MGPQYHFRCFKLHLLPKLKMKMMINGLPALSVVVICTVYLLGYVAGDGDTDVVPQKWADFPQKWADCMSCRCIAAHLHYRKELIEQANPKYYCETMFGLDLPKLYVGAQWLCPNGSVVIQDAERLMDDVKECNRNRNAL